MVVLDCSYALALVMPDEAQPGSMAEVQATDLIAPAVWTLEVANAVAMAARRGRLDPDEAAGTAQRMDGYGVVVEPESATVYQCFLTAEHHGFTSYDAAYLELALQHRCALATLDRRLAERARVLGITVLS